MKRTLIAIVLTSLAPAAYSQESARDARPEHHRGPAAIAQIQRCTDASANGFAVFSERSSSDGVKLITLVMNGLTEGKHAVHVHEIGTCSPCTAAGGHFDPGPASNSSPGGNHPFHMGDLVNIEADGNGRGVLSTTTSRFTLSSGPLGLFDADGSALIVHVGADTYCPDGAVTGCAGGLREACGVIRRTR